MIPKKLQDLKNRLDKIIEKDQESRALEKVTLESLKKEFNINNLKEAEKLILNKKKEKSDIDDEFEELVDELETEMEKLELI